MIPVLKRRVVAVFSGKRGTQLLKVNAPIEDIFEDHSVILSQIREYLKDPQCSSIVITRTDTMSLEKE